MSDWPQMVSPVLGSDTPLSSAAVLGAAVCLVWGGGVAVWGAVRLHRHSFAGRKRFLDRAIERGFDRDEAMILWRLGRFSPDGGKREAILASCEAFDLCLHAAEEAAGDDPVSWPDYLAGSVTSALRRKYADARGKTRQRIGHTRDIEANQPVQVRLADGTAFKSFVLNVTEENLQLSLPGEVKLPPHVRADGSAFLSFWRPHDARYECKSSLVAGPGERDGNGRNLGLCHAALNRVQEREHVRVRCRQEVRFGVVEEPFMAADSDGRAGEFLRQAQGEPELPFVAMLHDLSNGGASFVTDKPIAPGSLVLLRIPLTRKPWFLTLSCRMLRQSLLEGTSNPSWASSVQFEPLSGRTENHLSRLIAQLQQRLIARMLSRAGAGEAAEAPREHTRDAQSRVERKPAWTPSSEEPAAETESAEPAAVSPSLTARD